MTIEKALLSTLAALAVVSLTGCSIPNYVASPHQEEGTQKIYREGVELLVSEQKQSTVGAGLRRLEDREKHMQLILLIRNRGERAFNVLPTKIEVHHEKENDSEVLSIYPPDEAVQKITFDERLAAALNAAAASYNQNTNINTQPNESLAATSTLSALAQSKNIGQTLLKRETLAPGQEVAGAAYFALKDEGRVRIEVPVGNSSHTFYFESQEE